MWCEMCASVSGQVTQRFIDGSSSNLTLFSKFALFCYSASAVTSQQQSSGVSVQCVKAKEVRHPRKVIDSQSLITFLSFIILGMTELFKPNHPVQPHESTVFKKISSFDVNVR